MEDDDFNGTRRTWNFDSAQVTLFYIIMFFDNSLLKFKIKIVTLDFLKIKIAILNFLKP